MFFLFSFPFFSSRTARETAEGNVCEFCHMSNIRFDSQQRWYNDVVVLSNFLEVKWSERRGGMHESKEK